MKTVPAVDGIIPAARAKDKRVFDPKMFLAKVGVGRVISEYKMHSSLLSIVLHD